MTIVLDCNIYVSLLINQQIDLIPELQKKGSTIACCKELLKEIADVLSRPKLKKRFFSTFTINDVLQLIKVTTTSFYIFDVPDVVSDKKDNYLFALCKASKADYFVTGDKLLLKEQQYQQTKIISLADFKTLIA